MTIRAGDTIKDMHDQAMAYADDAFIHRRMGKLERAKKLFAKAYALEVMCAGLSSTEPSKGILYLSAAWLAFHAGDYAIAQGFITSGLSSALEPQRAELLVLQHKLQFPEHPC